MNEIEHFDSFGMFCSSKRFGKYVGNLRSRGNVLKSNMTFRAGVSNKMMTNIDVFCASVFDVIFDMIECRSGVCIDHCGVVDFDADRGNEFAKEYCFFCCVREFHIF